MGQKRHLDMVYKMMGLWVKVLLRGRERREREKGREQEEQRGGWAGPFKGEHSE